jgi:hypothetical protein
MAVIVQFPAIVEELLETFGPVFPDRRTREHFGEYLTGLLVARRKNVSAINREFAQTTDQSCLNRFLTQSNWDVSELNRLRLAWLQKEPSTRYSKCGVIPIDNVLIDHTGQHIEDVGYFWDHAEDRYKIAHDYLIVNYVCTSGKHYPLEFRRFAKKEHCQADGREFRDHNVLFRELIDWVIEREIPGTFTFDSWFTHADNLNHIHAATRAYVGDLKTNRKLETGGRVLQAKQWAAQIPVADRKKIVHDGQTQWYFTKSVHIPKVNHKVRLVILWSERGDAAPRKILVSNQTHWDVNRVVRTYRQRWTGTECFHRDGKQELGMGDCQLRSGRGQTRHMYLVFAAYSMLIRQLESSRSRGWAHTRLKTIGEACMAATKESLSQTIHWILERIENDHWPLPRVEKALQLV